MSGCAGPKSTNDSIGTQTYTREEIGNWINNRHFIFKANTALPSIGPSRYITNEYDVQLSPDSLISHLPYFGRAYRAPADPSKGGIQFTSTRFEYIVEIEQEGWSVLIKPVDYSEVQQMFFNISASGMATLHVTSTFRQPIVFNGSIEPRKQAKAF